MEDCLDRKSKTTTSDQNFWQSINILITKPHIVNKKLWGSTILKKHYIETKNDKWDDNFEKYELKVITKTEEFFNELSQKNNFQITDHASELEIMLLELLPKSHFEAHAFQMICINKLKNQVTFYDITPHQLPQKICPTFPYSFLLKDNEIILNSADISMKSYFWLKDTVLPQLVKWSEELPTKPVRICSESLQLVANEKYYSKYHLLKMKYGKEIVKIWPESTDPLKFVYEDVAIATYLLLLWSNYSGPQTFADIGCGNGLLVYILTMEGHNGFGVDVRKRKIWDIYPDKIELNEYTLTPFNMNIFSNVDWVIGNHSDEMTPWIPVIAAKSSYNCKFFLLPCCAYNFDGTKYRRKDSSKSQYTEYLQHIKELCEYCGFETQIDRLKIPSTKRICFVGQRRNYEENEHVEKLTLIQDFVNEEIGLEKDANNPSNFKPRETVEKVKNCTQVDKNTIDIIVKQITNFLLEDCNLEQNWSRGKKVEINELVQLISPDNLKILKSECGGLQTLLKNNHSIFEVRNGTVQLRYPKTVDEMMKNKKKKNNEKLKVQVKQCWFYKNHPQGCPLENSLCSFLHENK